MSDLMDYAEECLSKPCELHSEHEKALYALRGCVTEMSRLMAALKDSRAEIERLSAVGEPVAWLCTDIENGNVFAAVTEHQLEVYTKRGRKIQPLYTAPPSVDALIAEIDGLGLHDTYVNFKDIRTILDKYRSAK